MSSSESQFDALRELRYLLAVTAPLFVVYLAQASLAFVDAYIVSHLGVDELAAVFPAGMSLRTLQGFGLGFFGVVATFVSQSVGRGRSREVGAYMWNAIFLALVFCAIFAVIGWIAAEPFFRSMGHTAIVQEHEVLYFRINLYGLPAFFLTAALTGFFTGTHKMRIVAFSMLMSIGLNILFTYLLVFGVGFLPKMGVAGAAWGTVLAVTLGTLPIVAVYLSKGNHAVYASRTLLISRKRCWQLLRLGLPSGLQLSWQNLSSWVFFLWMMGHFGTAALAATNIIQSYLAFLFMPALAIGVTLASSVGMAIGEGSPEVASRRAFLIFWITSGYLAAAGALMLAFRRPLVELFSTDAAVVSLGLLMFLYGVAFQLLEGASVVFIAALRGAGDTQWTAKASIAASCVFLILVCYLIVMLYPQFGPGGPWFAKLLYAAAVSALMLARWKRGRWRKLDIFR